MAREETNDGFEVFGLPGDGMGNYLVKLARHNPCQVKQDVIEAASEAEAVRTFARRHKADITGAQVGLAQAGDLPKTIVGGR